MEQIINILIGLGGAGFFAFLILKGRKDKRDNDRFDTYKESKVTIKPPDLNKIKEGIKDETPQESVDHVNNLFNELFPD